MESTENKSSWTSRLRLISIVLIVAALVLLVQALPVENLLRLFRNWVAGLGVWGPVIFAGVYAIWSVLFLPGLALTLAGGAVFGLGLGVITVLPGATVGAALSFLIARYMARERVSEIAKRNPKFAAIDRAIGEGGWKIVALLRLSPAIPFNLQNYLYGVTAIRFWPCMLASFVFMAPGTFLYVYLGHIGAQGIEAASGGGGKSAGQWAMLVVGLLATVLVTVYVTRIATQAIKKQTALDVSPAANAETAPAKKQASPRAAIVTAAVAVVLFSSALYAFIERDSLAGVFGPPRVKSEEAYQRSAAGEDFDHSAFDSLLNALVDDEGFVDYEGWRARASELDAYIAALGEAPFEPLGRDQKLALLINAYNAFTIRLILDYPQVASITEIPSPKRWDDRRWTIAGRLYSLSDIEHREIRPNFAEPRIHFALVCAALGCPPLLREAYRADRLEEQLDDQARRVHASARWFRFDAASDILHLTALYDWYGGDFSQQAASALSYAARYSPELKAALDAGREVAVEWIDYDWTLNVNPHFSPDEGGSRR